jgi:PadR family transcriptional regulator PadR
MRGGVDARNRDSSADILSRQPTGVDALAAACAGAFIIVLGVAAYWDASIRVLHTFALEPMHGYGIGVRLRQISKDVFQVNAGSLFPAIRHLERDGLIAGEWQTTEGNRRAKYYTLTASGRARLKQEARDWEGADLRHRAHF